MSDSAKAAPKSIDARALRTRHLLAEALMSLGAARGVDDLDVGEIVEEAGVARSTFYAHYAGKDDFLVRSFVNMVAATKTALRERYPEREDLLPSRALFTHVCDARDLHCALCAPTCSRLKWRRAKRSCARSRKEVSRG